MKIKALGVTLGTIALWSGALVAQSSTVSDSAAGINAPKSTLSVTPAVATGARSVLAGNLAAKNTEAANVAGAFLTPKLAIDYKSATIDFMLDYELEMFSGKGFGNPTKRVSSIQKNSYFQNHPVVIAGFKFAPDWTLSSTNDLSHKLGVDNEDNSLIEITSINEVLYKINNTFTVGAGWRFDYASSQATTKSAIPETDLASVSKAAINNAPSENPSTIINSAAARVKVKFNDQYALNTIMTAGIRRDEDQKAFGDSTTKYRYRINNDLTVSSIKNLDLALRYRLQLEDVKGASKGTWLNLGRVIANYSVAKNWTLDLTNTFVAVTPRDAKNSKGQDNRTTYENENYVGVTYKF